MEIGRVNNTLALFFMPEYPVINGLMTIVIGPGCLLSFPFFFLVSGTDRPLLG
jgi:hypothetical protein